MTFTDRAERRGPVEPVEVLVLGATGFIGGRVATRLQADDHERVHPASFQRVDLSLPDEVDRLVEGVRPGVALVMTAVVRRTVDDTFEAMLKNVTMVQTVLARLAPKGLSRAIFLSSIDVYGRPPVVLPIAESSPVRPTTYYGVGKVACELLFGLLEHVPVTILRLPGVYGVTDGGRSVVGTFLRRIASGETILLTGDGSALRDYIHVDDAAEIVSRCLRAPVPGVFNVVTGRSVRIKDVVMECGDALGVRPTVSSIPDADTGGDAVFDATKIRATWPTVPFRRIETGIREYATALRR